MVDNSSTKKIYGSFFNRFLHTKISLQTYYSSFFLEVTRIFTLVIKNGKLTKY